MVTRSRTTPRVGSDYGPGGFDRTPMGYEQIKQRVQRRLLNEAGSSLSGPSDMEIRRLIEQILTEEVSSQQIVITRTERASIYEQLVADILGFGPLQPLLDDETVTEILVNGPNSVYVERGGLLEKTKVRFDDQDELMRIIERIVAPLGRRVDESSPMVDARLPDGSRVNVIIPPLSLVGPAISIRKFIHAIHSADDLIRLNTLTQPMADFLRACVLARLNIVVSGGTSTGKTTFLNILSNFIPERERIVTIEDAAELQLDQDHLVRLESRPPNVEGKGAVPIRQLVINALRMRPDRIIVGEVRGGEALDMLQAMNTGHDGSLTTAHSNSPRDTLHRIETMTLMAGMELPLRAVREQISSAFDLVVHLARLSDGTRKVTQISEVQGLEGDVIVMQDIFTFEQIGVEGGKVIGYHTAAGIPPKFIDKLRSSGVEIPPDTFAPTVSQRQQQKRGGWH